MRKAAFAVAAAAALALALFGCGSKQAGIPETVAKVDGQAISGTDFYNQLNMAAGRRVMPMVIEQQILLNWAKSEGVPVTEEQVNKQLETLKRDGNYEDQVTNAGGEESLRSQYRGAQARINLSEKFNKFTDSELQTMYNNPMMKKRYVHGERKRVEVVVSTNPKNIKDAEKAAKEGKDFDSIAMRYSDPQFVMGGPAKTMVAKGEGPEGLVAAADATKEGEVSKPFTFTLGQMGTLQGLLKVTGTQPKADIKFKDAKEEIKGLMALQKTMEPDFQKKLDAQKKKADITIELPQYKDVVEQIKNPPPAMQMPMMAPPTAKPSK